MPQFQCPQRYRGNDAQGEVTVEVEHGGHFYRGRGVSTDSILASAKAFLNAINRIIATDGRPTKRISPFENRAADWLRLRPRTPASRRSSR